MTLKQVRECDVFGTVRDVEKYYITIAKSADDTGKVVDAMFEEVDLSPRGLARLKKFINRGLLPPTATGGSTEGAEHGTTP